MGQSSKEITIHEQLWYAQKALGTILDLQQFFSEHVTDNSVHKQKYLTIDSSLHDRIVEVDKYFRERPSDQVSIQSIIDDLNRCQSSLEKSIEKMVFFNNELEKMLCWLDPNRWEPPHD